MTRPFGPVAPVMTVRSFDQAIGTVKINAVFGGAPGGAAHPHGNSGLGYGYGPELLDEVTRTRVVHHLALGPHGSPVPD